MSVRMSDPVPSPQGVKRDLADAQGTTRISGTTVADMLTSLRRDPWRFVLGFGVLWLLLGMVVMPAGASFNPGKAYQGSLIVLMYLPALCLAFAHRGRLWRRLWPLPLFRVFLLMLAWATVSLAWAALRRPGDELGRLLSVMTFVLAWQIWDADTDDYPNALLFVGGMGVALCAGFYCVLFLLHPDPSERISGDGTIATTNYAAALMGAVVIWLTQLRLPMRTLSALRWLAILALLAFVGMTHTRGVWLALGACVVLAPLWQSMRLRHWLIAIGLLVLAVAIAIPTHLLTERGTSLRPQLLEQSLLQIAQHPWLGQGQGTPISLWVAGQVYTHSHNVLSQVLLELGIPGLALTLALWFLTGWQGWRQRHEFRGRILLGLWVYASVVLQFDMPQLLDSPRPGWILVWLPVSLAVALALRKREAGSPDIIPGN
ncbi:O-antigen ligase [Luteibacter sp. Sphag1AF]|uniref:O-antigen ligase family protein n=1 Tax=Luteibacter sp. Sphag1AF TaxID=2587031 RepID=UPI00161261E7|nr:O-antigen ligase family protein [Luteibacter sp. Sphag1AF]MBB3226416.1 O-antigen ligase [Luteibacter sp. Sphag1AF]